MQQIVLLPPIYRINIENELSNFKRTIFDRLLLAFNGVEKEAKAEGNRSLDKANKYFDPDYDDIVTAYENATDIEVSYYLTEMDFKQHFIKSTTAYLFHLFEKQLQSIFKKNNSILGFVEKEMNKRTNDNFSNNSDWLLIKKDLNLLSNAIKHGKGWSFDELKKNHPQYFKNYGGLSLLHQCFTPDDIFVTEEMLEDFFDRIKNVWGVILPHYVDLRD